MKRFAKFVFTILIDVIIVCVLTFSFIIFAEHTSGFVFSKVHFFNENSLFENLIIWGKTFGVISTVYLLFSVVFRNSIGYLAVSKGRFVKALKLFFSKFVDWTIIILATLITDFLLQKLFYYDFFILLLAIFVFYEIVIALCKGNSFGKWIVGIELDGKSSIFIYVFYKFIFVIVLPLLLFSFLGISDYYALFVDIVVFYLFFIALSAMFIKKTLWAYLAKISYTIKTSKLKFVFYKIISLYFVIVIGFLVLTFLNNRNHKNDDVLFGFNFPYEHKKYPHKNRVEPYVDFLKNQSLSPKEYILSLFKDKDIVILQETYHGESTQWELISEIVSDTFFIKNVGHFFTEYGSAIHQNKIDRFLNTVFPNDTILEQETACLMYYMSGGFYYFIKNLNLLNSKLPDSLKVKEHYCDVIDWDYFSSFPINQADDQRDSLMAKVTVDWYNEQVKNGKRHKCLVVTNTRHAMGYNGGIEKVKNAPNFFHLTNGNQGQYIWEAFPDETAAVIQIYNVNPRFFFLPMSQPINKGKWDLAFELNGNKPTGFNLENSPFGNDYFDAYPLRGAKTLLKYEDIFTGLIFNKPFIEQNSVTHPFHKFAIEKEASEKSITNTQKYKNIILCSTDNATSKKNMKWAKMISISNFAGIFLYLGLSFISIFVGLIYFTEQR